MTDTLRFPNLADPVEAAQVITLLSAVPKLFKGGAATFVSILPLKSVNNQTESPFIDLVLEFTADADLSIDSATGRAIGLYGQLGTVAAVGRTLLGILGYTTVLGQMPRIEIVSNAAGQLVGTSQIVQVAAAYTALSIGGITADINFDAGQLLTVKVRPVTIRNYIG